MKLTYMGTMIYALKLNKEVASWRSDSDSDQQSAILLQFARPLFASKS